VPDDSPETPTAPADTNRSDEEITMKLERVLVGVDFSSHSVEAARWTANHLARGAEIVLAHIISLPAPPPIVQSRYPQRELVVDTLREGADKRLRDLSLSLSAQRIWLEVREGTPADELARLATDFAVDLVVVGAHGERPGELTGIGTAAERLLAVSPAPVLLVAHAPDAPPTRILVPVDDSETSTAALRWAGMFGTRFDAEVTALHVAASGAVSQALTAAAIVSGVIPPATPEPAHTSKEAERWRELAVGAGVAPERLRAEVVSGSPVQQILDTAERAGTQLIVMGRRGSGGIRRAVLGSVVGGVVQRPPCPVLVVVEQAAS
jgi:nucleotide-binding universal stress UspA family protein